ncbi:hypothetical protein Pmar_PMAR003729 [Perkinsus marinus ATCC 50983]|uniref:Uncharacterized protein n=1 Tax=Perkinsus marinus (strain ATCC 50983 / TXsc) TaxID=423536 RepID=C5KI53_PERM5|nr:hypothetical protein Pmar_PMAR003729 [Perkinsus marinus ATCC 50983]EER16265.1 hypothetical protein Pmar_PMAR003729 [Perkinsus marinus ATCC 50983]|eukprot:XP_002784469.1 hypothetical protein Pmar_PMAR003729 [Perkinsus marinus ATCC 50983]
MVTSSPSFFIDILRWVFLPFREAFTLQFLAAAVWLFSCSVWNCMVQVYIDRLYAQQYFGNRHWDPLPDAGFALLPYINNQNIEAVLCHTRVCILTKKPNDRGDVAAQPIQPLR